LKVVEVDVERNLLLLRGAVPGAEGGNVIVRPSLKAARQGARKKLMPVKSGPPAKAAPPVKAAPAAKAPAAAAAGAAKK
jgi:large subunit ribosomal protein L3